MLEANRCEDSKVTSGDKVHAVHAVRGKVQVGILSLIHFYLLVGVDLTTQV